MSDKIETVVVTGLKDSPIHLFPGDSLHISRTEAAQELVSLEVILEKIARIAHCGGLVEMSEDDALIAIRKLTISFFKKNETIGQTTKQLTKTLKELAKWDEKL